MKKMLKSRIFVVCMVCVGLTALCGLAYGYLEYIPGTTVVGNVPGGGSGGSSASTCPPTPCDVCGLVSETYSVTIKTGTYTYRNEEGMLAETNNPHDYRCCGSPPDYICSGGYIPSCPEITKTANTFSCKVPLNFGTSPDNSGPANNNPISVINLCGGAAENTIAYYPCGPNNCGTQELKCVCEWGGQNYIGYKVCYWKEFPCNVSWPTGTMYAERSIPYQGDDEIEVGVVDVDWQSPL